MKKKMLSILPENSNGIDEAVTPPQKSIIRIHELPKVGVIDTNTRLITHFRDIEKSQMSFLLRALQADGMPRAIKVKLKMILEMYQNTVDQLDRFTKTQQYKIIAM